MKKHFREWKHDSFHLFKMRDKNFKDPDNMSYEHNANAGIASTLDRASLGGFSGEPVGATSLQFSMATFEDLAGFEETGVEGIF